MAEAPERLCIVTGEHLPTAALREHDLRVRTIRLGGFDVHLVLSSAQGDTQGAVGLQ